MAQSQATSRKSGKQGSLAAIGMGLLVLLLVNVLMRLPVVASLVVLLVSVALVPAGVLVWWSKHRSAPTSPPAAPQIIARKVPKVVARKVPKVK